MEPTKHHKVYILCIRDKVKRNPVQFLDFPENCAHFLQGNIPVQFFPNTGGG